MTYYTLTPHEYAKDVYVLRYDPADEKIAKLAYLLKGKRDHRATGSVFLTKGRARKFDLLARAGFYPAYKGKLAHAYSRPVELADAIRMAHFILKTHEPKPNILNTHATQAPHPSRQLAHPGN